MKTFLTVFLCFLFAGLNASSQNLSGTWEGGGTGGFFRLVIIQQGDSCFGYTYNIQRGCCKANFSGTYNETNKKFKAHGIDFIEKSPGKSLFSFNLNYSEKDGIPLLTGKSSSITRGDPALAFPHAITLCKKSSFVDTSRFMASKIINRQSQIINKKDEKKVYALTDLGLVKKSRTSALIQTLQTNADSIRLVLFDNGEIDGDTVTVFYNGAIIINSVALGLKPFEITLPLNKSNPVNTIELMANNLGSIPPNTALMLILTGTERHELRVSSDYTTNAQINIRHKENNK